MLYLLVAINIFVGMVNLLPMLPLDGGHVAIAAYERIRSRTRAAKYHADVAKLMPVAYVFLAFFIVARRSRALYLEPGPSRPAPQWLDFVRSVPQQRTRLEAPDRHTARLTSMPRTTATMAERRRTRQIAVGKVPVGGGAPVSVQSMTTTKTADVEGTLAQIYALAAAGADIVRCTCNEEAAAEGLAQIVPRSPVPIVADIHFHHEMALAALEAGVQGLRLNPGNLRKPEEIKHVAAEARDRGVPIRIGVNAGSPAPRPLQEATAAPRPRRWSSRRASSSPTSRRSASPTSRSRSRRHRCR